MVKSLVRSRRFSHFKDEEFECDDRLFAEAGSHSWAAISKLADETRKSPMGVRRGKFHFHALEISLVGDISTHYENERPRRAVSHDPLRESPYGEIVIPSLRIDWRSKLEC